MPTPRILLLLAGTVLASSMSAGLAQAQQPAPAGVVCPVTQENLVSALHQAVNPAGGPTNGGFDNNEWAAVVNRGGVICAIAFSGSHWDQQWFGSRSIAAEKAYTANAFSSDSAAASTANLFWPTQPGGILYGLLTSNPLNPAALYAGKVEQYGTDADPLIGKRIGGTTSFGGGLALYQDKKIVGGLGLSGDSSCADHNVAWRIRKTLKLDSAPKGISGEKNDGIIYDIGSDGRSKSGFGHPKCQGTEDQIAHQIGASTTE